MGGAALGGSEFNEVLIVCPRAFKTPSVAAALGEVLCISNR